VHTSFFMKVVPGFRKAWEPMIYIEPFDFTLF